MKNTHTDIDGRTPRTDSYELGLAFQGNRVTVSKDGTDLGSFDVTGSGDLLLGSDDDPLVPMPAVVLLEALPAAPSTKGAGSHWQVVFPADDKLPDDKFAMQIRFAGKLEKVEQSKGRVELRGDYRQVKNSRSAPLMTDPSSSFARIAQWTPSIYGTLLFDDTQNAFESGVFWVIPIPDPDVTAHEQLRNHTSAHQIHIERRP